MGESTPAPHGYNNSNNMAGKVRIISISMKCIAMYLNILQFEGLIVGYTMYNCITAYRY